MKKARDIFLAEILFYKDITYVLYFALSIGTPSQECLAGVKRF